MTPTSINQHVLALLARIGSPAPPQFLAVEPAPYAVRNECIAAVAEKIHRDRGSRTMGWQIWQSEIVIEGEMHAVWCAPDATLHDVTPKPEGIDRILFLPDPRLAYQGKQIDSVRLNISGNPVGDDFIRATEGLFRIMNKDERASQDTVSLSPDDLFLMKFLVAMQSGTQQMVRQNLGLSAPCLCPSGKAYEDCHRVQLNDALEDI
jgi:hypothetical protein